MPATPLDQRLRPVTGLVKSLSGVFGIRLEEELKYYVILKDKDIQIRKYRPFILAQTMVRGEFDVARELGMRRLNAYLQGHNDFRERFALTTPVFQSRGDRISFTTHKEATAEEENWVMGIILPARVGLGNMPHPLEKNIKLVKVPSLLVAVARYSGANTEALVDEHASSILQWLEKKFPKYKVISEPRYAQYDAPYVLPLLRRNEVHITITDTEVPQKKFH